MTDTICALATPTGGAIGVIRVSGPEAIAITGRLFHPVHGHTSASEATDAFSGVHVRTESTLPPTLASAKGYTLHYGRLTTIGGEDIDDVVVSVYRAPRSYTGEDSTEISCHGSRYVLQMALQALIDAGCRQAEPGEYTRRAFLNGKMDLSQAEAVADLIAATNRATHQVALSQLRGHFSSELSLLREQLLKMTALLELELDFSDHEDLEFADRHELLDLATTIDSHVCRLADSFKTGKAIKEGVAVAIVGKTNVGKSTLLNRLLHEDKAIVSNIGGTTRDAIEGTTTIHGVTFRFIDTAGIRETQDEIEQIGIQRALQKMEEALIVVWMIDAIPTKEEAEAMARRNKNKAVILVVNKSDLLLAADFHHSPHHSLSPHSSQPHPSPTTFTKDTLKGLFPTTKDILFISAKTGDGISSLEEVLYRAADIPAFSENDVVVTSLRHYQSLTKAHESLTWVIDGLRSGLSPDLLAEDLRTTLSHLADITGTISSQETLNTIFSRFCVGK